jgi:hypothetical protein
LLIQQNPNTVGDESCNNFPKDLCNPPLIATTGVNAGNGPDLG